MKLVLASASPARLATLQAAGIEPEVVVSGVDESQLDATVAEIVAAELSILKCRSVAETRSDQLVLGCDSVLAFGGEVLGKPADAAEAAQRWRSLRGHNGVLHTGHCLRLGDRELSEVASTVVHFGDITDAEIDAYVATGEPLAVAGGFTIDGLGGAFIDRVDGDHHNVVGLSLPLLRRMLAELGVSWPDLWT